MKTKTGVTISTSNSKLGGFVPTVNLPPIVTCRKGAPCARQCYACKGNFRFPSVRASLENNLQVYRNSANGFFGDIVDFLKNGLVTYKFFRWHSAGDIVDGNYFLGMVATAKKCPDTKFLAFTKKFEIVNDFLSSGSVIPENLVIVFSAWDKSFAVPNPYNFPVAYVDFCDNAQNPEIPVTAFACKGACDKCLTCWQLKQGQATVFHQH